MAAISQKTSYGFRHANNGRADTTNPLQLKRLHLMALPLLKFTSQAMLANPSPGFAVLVSPAKTAHIDNACLALQRQTSVSTIPLTATTAMYTYNLAGGVVTPSGPTPALPSGGYTGYWIVPALWRGNARFSGDRDSYLRTPERENNPMLKIS